MDGANDEARFAKIWNLKWPYLKLEPTITMINYGV
jgi:hypothetical protein